MKQFELYLTHKEFELITTGIDCAINAGYNDITVVNSLRKKMLESIRVYYGDD